jgi:hypothetical protein
MIRFCQQLGAILAAGAILSARMSFADNTNSAPSAPLNPSPVKFLELAHPGPFAFYKCEKKGVALVVAKAPVTLQPGVIAGDLNLMVILALFGSQDLGANGRIIAAELAPEGGATFVRLSGPFSTLPDVKRFGTYQFIVQVRHSKSPQIQTLNLTVQYPQTKLLTPAKLRFNLRTRWWCDPKSLNGCTFPLGLGEGPRAEDLVLDAERLDTGTLTFASQPQVERHHVNLVQVHADNLPMGETTTNLTIRSPDIEAVTVPVTVSLRETPVTIVWIALIGIIAGLIVRVLANRVIDLQNVKIQWNRLRGDIDQQRLAMADEVYTKKFHDLETEISTQLKRLNVTVSDSILEGSKNALTTKRAELEKLVNEFLGQQNDLRTRLANFEKLTGVAFELPAPLLILLHSEGEKLDEIRPKIEQGELGEAEKALNKLERSACQDLWDCLDQWHLNLISMLGKWMAILPPLPKEAVDGLKQAQTTLETKFNELKPPSDPDGLRKLIESASYFMQVGRQGVERTLRTTAVAVETVLQVLGAEKDDGAKWQSLERAVRGLNMLQGKKVVSNASPDDTPAIALLKKLTANLKDAVNRASDSPEPLSEEQQQLRKQVDQAIKEGQYEDAAILAIRLRKAAPALQQLANGKTLQSGQPDQSNGFVLPASHKTVIEIESIHESRIESASAALPAVFRLPADEISRSERTIFVVKAFQLSLVTALLCGIAYILFEKTFVGTVGDPFTIFFWGFTLDIGVNTLVEKAGTLIASAKR